MEEEIKVLNDYLDENDRKFVKPKRLKFLQAIENLINENKEQQKMIEIMSKAMHYICLFNSQSKYVIAKYCKIYNSENIGECEDLICSECVANYFRKKAKGG